ncbi:MAG TPA: ABC transporter permease [Anaerolineales bacterium]|nr:ABC transporter permease [Anaerolineales bacterium]
MESVDLMWGREVYDSARQPPPLADEFLSLLRYRDLVAQWIARSVKTRYKRSLLGVAWTMVNPLLTMAVLTVVFSRLFRTPVRDYPLYVLSGLLLWNFVAQSTTAAMGELVWSGGLLGRAFVPKAVFAVSAVGTGLVNLILALIPYAVISLLLGVEITSAWLLLPLPILIAAAFALGLGLLVSTAAVYFADVMPTYDVLLMAWLYLTPVIYSMELLPPGVRTLLQINPMVHLIGAFRSVIYEGQPPEGGTLLMAGFTALGMLALGWWTFTRKARDFAYRL